MTIDESAMAIARMIEATCSPDTVERLLFSGEINLATMLAAAPADTDHESEPTMQDLRRMMEQ